MLVSELTPASTGDWDAYVARARDGHPFQLSGWRNVMQASYGFRDWYLIAHENGEIMGILPLYQVRSLLVGTSVTSLPRGICAETSAAAEALLQSAKKITESARVGSLVIRDSRHSWSDESAWYNNCSIAVRPLPDNVAALKKSIKRQLLQHVRKADAAGVQTATMTCGHAGAQDAPGDQDCPCRTSNSAVGDAKAGDLAPDLLTQRDLHAFYFTFCDLLHEKGVPVFGRKVVDAIREWLPDRLAITIASVNGEAIGAILHLMLNDTVFATWGGSPSRYRGYCSSHALWWASMAFGVDRGYRYLDMGRSLCGSGSEQFKYRWGGRIEPIYRYTFALRGRGAYDPTEDDCADLKYQMFTKVWARLPSVVVRVIGPWLRRQLPFA